MFYGQLVNFNINPSYQKNKKIKIYQTIKQIRYLYQKQKNDKIIKYVDVNIKIKYHTILQQMVKTLSYFIIGLSSTFILTSSFFFYFPKLLRNTNKFNHQLFNEALIDGKLLRISHRGSPRYTTQNTIEAFQKVSDISDILQMDVCQTSDNILIVHHDLSLFKSCGVDRLISSMKYEDLPRYQDSIQLDFAYQRYFKTNNQKIPTLQSVFQAFQGISMNIQLKTPTKSAIKQFIRLIHKYHRQSITIVGIRGKESVQLSEYNLKLKHQNQNQQKKQKILLFMSDKTVIKVYLAYFFGLLPFINIKQASMQIPVYSKQFEEWFVAKGKKNGQSQLKLKLSCKILKLINYLSKPLIGHLTKRGILTYGWVCNTQESLQLAKYMGIQGIMSDQPYKLNKFAEELQIFNKKQK